VTQPGGEGGGQRALAEPSVWLPRLAAERGEKGGRAGRSSRRPKGKKVPGQGQPLSAAGGSRRRRRPRGAPHLSGPACPSRSCTARCSGRCRPGTAGRRRSAGEGRAEVPHAGWGRGDATACAGGMRQGTRSRAPQQGGRRPPRTEQEYCAWAAGSRVRRQRAAASRVRVTCASGGGGGSGRMGGRRAGGRAGGRGRPWPGGASRPSCCQICARQRRVWQQAGRPGLGWAAARWESGGGAAALQPFVAANRQPRGAQRTCVAFMLRCWCAEVRFQASLGLIRRGGSCSAGWRVEGDPDPVPGDAVPAGACAFNSKVHASSRRPCEDERAHQARVRRPGGALLRRGARRSPAHLPAGCSPVQRDGRLPDHLCLCGLWRGSRRRVGLLARRVTQPAHARCAPPHRRPCPHQTKPPTCRAGLGDAALGGNTLCASQCAACCAATAGCLSPALPPACQVWTFAPGAAACLGGGGGGRRRRAGRLMM
jgi:hypothetical protein